MAHTATADLSGVRSITVDSPSDSTYQHEFVVAVELDDSPLGVEAAKFGAIRRVIHLDGVTLLMSTQNHVSDASGRSGYCTLFNPYVDSVAEELVQTVSALRDASPMEISPLYRVVDPDALEALFGGSNTDDGQSSRVVMFDYEGFEVTIRNDGCMTLTPVEAA